MNREMQIENLLRTHPGVRDAAVLRDSSGSIQAFVVADDGYLDGELDRRTTAAMTLGKWQKAYDLSQLTKEAAAAPIGFNTIGWNSNYTRRPIPDTEMKEWVELTTADILRLAPRDVYEIGCGTGLLVTRIAPRCDRYTAVDFAPEVLTRLREQLLAIPDLNGRVQTMQRRADNFSGLHSSSFDTALLSSVVQYFPNIAYLTKVLEGAVDIVKPGGHVYVGDVRNLPLLPAFASSVELFQAADNVTAGELRQRVRRRIDRDPELVLSPAYFLTLAHRLQKISKVEIRPLRGHGDNEMSRYRYQAILHIGTESEAPSEIEFIDWAEQRFTIDDIRAMLRRHSAERIGIQRIRNARIERDIEALVCLRSAEVQYTAGELQRDLAQIRVKGIHPQALYDLKDEGLGFSVFLSWAACRTDGSYDALFLPTQDCQSVSPSAINWPQAEPSQFVYLANSPGQSKLRAELISQLAAHCAQSLLGGLATENILLVDALTPALGSDMNASGLLAARNAALYSS